MGFIQKEAERMVTLLAGKNKDYTTTDEFSNFREAAEFSGLLPEDVIMGQLGIKVSRIKGLTFEGWRDAEAVNESLKDSFRDLAGYALIAAAWLEKLEADVPEPFEEDPRFVDPDPDVAAFRRGVDWATKAKQCMVELDAEAKKRLAELAQKSVDSATPLGCTFGPECCKDQGEDHEPPVAVRDKHGRVIYWKREGEQ